jgi:hypothetical protein
MNGVCRNSHNSPACSNTSDCSGSNTINGGICLNENICQFSVITAQMAHCAMI